MSRLPLDVIEIEFGEDARYSPPPGAERWSAFSRTDILSTLNDEPGVNPLITHGGRPPQWAIIGGWNVTADAFIPPPSTSGQPRVNVTGFEDPASAAGFAIEWGTLAAASSTGLREMLMVLAYEGGKAVKRTIFRTPASSSIDPGVIAAQERLLLQSLLRTRDQRAGSGGVIRLDHGEAGAEEFESLAVLDRRIAETRARISWFEAAAEGNNLPRAVYW